MTNAKNIEKICKYAMTTWHSDCVVRIARAANILADDEDFMALITEWCDYSNVVVEHRRDCFMEFVNDSDFERYYDGNVDAASERYEDTLYTQGVMQGLEFAIDTMLKAMGIIE